MRDNDVKSLLTYVEDKLVDIKKTYDQSLQDKDVPASLRTVVKNAMENLRSSLEYMAKDVYETIITLYRNTNNKAPLKRIYFPYGQNEQVFNKLINTYLPDLKIVRPDIYSLIEDIQPHVCGNTWLYDLCRIVNHNKHDSLSPQTPTSRKTYSVGPTGKGKAISASAKAIKAAPGKIRIGGIPITFDPNTGIPQQTPGLDLSVTTWVSFVFQDTRVEVYPLLMTAFREIRETSKKLYEKILEHYCP